MPKFILITNLDRIQLDEKTLANCSALLLEESDPIIAYQGGASYRVRAFGPDPAWSIFTIILGCRHTDYTLTELVDEEFKVRFPNGEKKPSPRGTLIQFRDTTSLVLHPYDGFDKLDFFESDDQEEIRSMLSVKTRRYWPHPGFPTLEWVNLRKSSAR